MDDAGRSSEVRLEEHFFGVCPDKHPLCYDEKFGEFEGRRMSVPDVDLVTAIFVEMQDIFEGPGYKERHAPIPKPTGDAGESWDGYQEAKRKAGR